MLRLLRRRHGKKHREIADAIGLKQSSYSNSESQPYKRMSIDKVHKLCTYYGLNDVQRLDMIRMWEAQPVSPFREKQLEYWKKRKEQRAKAKGFDQAAMILVDFVGVVVGHVPDAGELCICEPPDLFDGAAPTEVQPCELCSALQFLGLPGWTTKEDVIERLAKLADELNARAAGAAGEGKS